MTLNDVKIFHGSLQSDWTSATSLMLLLAEKLRVNVFLLQFRFFVNVLIEMNVNISNELNFSDVYRNVNYPYGKKQGYYIL